MDERGYLQAWIGGVLGGALGGAIGGFLAADVYLDAHPELGLDALGVPLVFVPVATLIGALTGVWLLLRILRYSRPLLSGVLYALLFIVLVPGIAGGGAILIPVDITLLGGAVVTLVCATLLSAVLAREVARRL